MTGSSELQGSLQMKCLPVPGKKLNTVFICVMSLMVSMWRATKHVRNFVRSNVRKYIFFDENWIELIHDI
jgi:hypothetical protein